MWEYYGRKYRFYEENNFYPFSKYIKNRSEAVYVFTTNKKLKELVNFKLELNILRLQKIKQLLKQLKMNQFI